MGLVLNPYAYRIGHVKSWSDTWYLISAEYVEFFHSSMFLKAFVYYVLYKFYPTRFSYWLLSHTEILFFNNIMYIWIYLYEASGRYKITKYIKRFKYGLFRSLRMKTFWLKKKLFDRNPVSLAIFNFLRIFGSHVEKYDTILNVVLDEEEAIKIGYLRKKYGYKWLGIEEIAILRTAIQLFLKSANVYALQYLFLMFKSLFFLPMKDYSLKQSRFHGPRVFLFFLSYFLSIVSTWPYYKASKSVFASKVIFAFLRQTVTWLFFRPFINNLSRFLEYLCSFFGYSSVFRASIIANFTLSAFFIARYIITAIRNGFNYLDIVYPIRKTLNRFMKLKIFDNFVHKNTNLRDIHFKLAEQQVIRRSNFIIIYLFTLRYKLFVSDLNIYSSSFNNRVYLKSFCFLNFYWFLRKLYINNRTNVSVIGSRNSHFYKFNYIFKRFFSNLYKKRILDFFSKRLTAEVVELERRLNRKPLRLDQKERYNYRRKIKRAEKSSTLRLLEQKYIYKTYNQRFYDKLSRTKKFYFFVVKNINNYKPIVDKRFFSTKMNRYFKTKKSVVLNSYFLNVIRFYTLYFIIKFFKFVKFKLNFEKKKKAIFKKRNKWKIKQYNIKKKFLPKRLKLLMLIKIKKFYFKFFTKFIQYYYHTFPLVFFLKFVKVRNFCFYLNYYIYNKIYIHFLSTNNDNHISKSNNMINNGLKKNKTNSFIFRKLILSRKFHSSSCCSDNIISILKSLVSDKKTNRHHFRRGIDYRKIISDMTVNDYRQKKINYNNIPSKILKKKFGKNLKVYTHLKATIKKNVMLMDYVIESIDNVILHNVYIYNENNIENLFLKDNLVIVMIKIYEYFNLLLLLNFYNITFYDEHFGNIYIWITKIINMLRSDWNEFYIHIHLFVKMTNLLIYNSIFFIRLIKIQRKSSSLIISKNKFLLANFIVKFSDLLNDKLVINNNFHSYFFYLLKNISLNISNINDFQNSYIKTLLNIVDFYWFTGFRYYKQDRKKFKFFFGRFRVIIAIIFIVFKVFLNNKDFHDRWFTLLCELFTLFLPRKYFNSLERVDEYFLPYVVYSTEANTLFYDVYKKVYYNNSIFSIESYDSFFEYFRFVEKKFLNLSMYFSFPLYKFFPVNIKNYFFYVDELVNSSNRIFILNTQFVTNKLLSYSNKLNRVKARDNVKSFLYGFKFHFVGRFTRKQQSASMWFRQGFLPTSTMNAEVDYGMFTIPLKFSACTIKVWLYRGVHVPKRTYTYGRWL